MGSDPHGSLSPHADRGDAVVQAVVRAVVFGHELQIAGPDVVLGAALVFGSALSYAIYLVYSGEVVKRLGSLRLTGLATSVACVFCIAQFLILRPISAASLKLCTAEAHMATCAASSDGVLCALLQGSLIQGIDQKIQVGRWSVERITVTHQERR